MTNLIGHVYPIIVDLARRLPEVGPREVWEYHVAYPSAKQCLASGYRVYQQVCQSISTNVMDVNSCIRHGDIAISDILMTCQMMSIGCSDGSMQTFWKRERLGHGGKTPILVRIEPSPT